MACQILVPSSARILRCVHSRLTQQPRTIRVVWLHCVRPPPQSAGALICARKLRPRHISIPHREYAKKAKGQQQRLAEDEQEVINLRAVESSMQTAISGLTSEYLHTVIARITPATLDRVMVEIDGQKYPLKQMAQIGMPNPSLIVINLSSYPQAVNNAVNALRSSDLNLNPIPEKNVIKVPIPKMSGELRTKLTKVAKSSAEKTKGGLRKARQKALSELKNKDNVSKDTVRKLEKQIQLLTDEYTAKIDDMLRAKTKELSQTGT